MFLGLQLLLLMTLSVKTDGYYYSEISECITSSPDLSDVEFLRNTYFNKKLDVQFNSTVGKFVGFSEFGMKNAEYWNGLPYLQQMQAELDRYCKHNLKNDYSVVLDKAVKPRIKLRSEHKASGEHPAMLMCSAYDFYPPAIDIYWLRDGKKETGSVTKTDEMSEGDWYYQIHTHLQYTPKSGEKITCVVEHTSSKKPMIYNWDPSYSESERSKVAIGTSGLVLGIILSGTGFIYYKKKSSGVL